MTQITQEQIQKLIAKEVKRKAYHKEYVAKRKAKDPNYAEKYAGNKKTVSLSIEIHGLLKKFATEHNLTLNDAVGKAITEFKE